MYKTLTKRFSKVKIEVYIDIQDINSKLMLSVLLYSLLIKRLRLMELIRCTVHQTPPDIRHLVSQNANS